MVAVTVTVWGTGGDNETPLATGVVVTGEGGSFFSCEAGDVV